jgi:hypothetical protein
VPTAAAGSVLADAATLGGAAAAVAAPDAGSPFVDDAVDPVAAAGDPSVVGAPAGGETPWTCAVSEPSEGGAAPVLGAGAEPAPSEGVVGATRGGTGLGGATLGGTTLGGTTAGGEALGAAAPGGATLVTGATPLVMDGAVPG